MQRKILFFILPFVALTFTGCVRYQYSALSSNPGVSVSTHQYQTLKDSVRLTYIFGDRAGNVRVKVENLGNEPLYIDWGRSVIVQNGKTGNFPSSRSSFQGDVVGSSVEITPRVSLGSGSFSGTGVSTPEGSFVPSGAFYESPAIEIPMKYRKLKNAPVKELAGGTRVKYLTFGKDDSPLRIQTYLTLSRRPDFQGSFVVSEEFWISEVIDLGVESQAPATGQPGLYTSRATGFGGAVVLLGAGAYAVVAASADQ